MKMVSFDVSKKDAILIDKIVERGMGLAHESDIQIDRLDADMDITAVHANGNPLRLQEFLEADTVNFCHDFFGIRQHIDRRTGHLKDFFLPRFTK